MTTPPPNPFGREEQLLRQAASDYEAILRAKASWADSPAPEPPEVPADELAAALAGMRSLVRTGAIPAITDDLRIILDEFDRMKSELTRTVADCGICRLGARTVHVNDDCPRHGEGDW